jgi:signal transduction histidine kinase
VTAWYRSTRPKGTLRRSLAAMTVTFGIIALRIALDPVLGRASNRHLFMLPGVMVAAWLAGFPAGVAATVVDAVALDCFFNGPAVGFSMRGVTAELLLFFLVGVGVSGLVESLRLARARADAAKEARDHLLAIVAHDLRNPLNSIRLVSTSLQRAVPEPATMQRRLATVDRSVDRMDRLIGDLVDATHIERDELKVSLREESASNVLREITDTFRPLATEKHVELDVVLPAVDLVLLADRDRLTQVFGNLLGNALKFTPADGRVWLRTRAEERAVHFEVQDTGPGIAPDDLPHVFERYWKSGGSGTGLGLFIARSIVAAHGGNLSVRSRAGQGATFFFAIPRVEVAFTRRIGATPEATSGSRSPGS